MNICFEWIFWILKKWIFIHEFAKTVVAKCLKPISNHSGIISGTYFRSFQGSLFGPQEGSETMFWPLFLNFEWFSSNSFEWIIPLHFPYSIEWIFFLNEYSRFCFELNHLKARFNEKMNFQNGSARAKSGSLTQTLLSNGARLLLAK